MEFKTGDAQVTFFKEIGFSQDVILHESGITVTSRVVYVFRLSVPFRFCALNARLRGAGEQYVSHVTSAAVGKEVGPRA